MGIFSDPNPPEQLETICRHRDSHVQLSQSGQTDDLGASQFTLKSRLADLRSTGQRNVEGPSGQVDLSGNDEGDGDARNGGCRTGTKTR